MSALPMWIDFQWNPHPEAILDPPSKCYESFLYFGPFVLLSETTDENNIELQILYKDLDNWVLIWSRDISENPFSAGMHRFIIGLEQSQNGLFNFKISIDGSAFESTSFNCVNLNFYEHTTYSNVAILNKTLFSNIAVFFKTQLPSQEWISGSQRVLNSTYRAARSTYSNELYGFSDITKTPGSLTTLLDKILVIGNQHESVVSLSLIGNSVRLQITDCSPAVNPSVGSFVTIGSNYCSVYDGCWRVVSVATDYIVIEPLPIKREELITVGIVNSVSTNVTIISNTTLTVYLRDNHCFRPNEIVSIGFTSTSLSHTWKVITSGGGTFTVDAMNSPSSMTFNGGCIVKKMPIGGGMGWVKSYTEDNSVSYTPIVSNITPKKITVKNDNERYGSVKLSSLDGTKVSDPVYFMSYNKHSYIRDTSIPWRSIGDMSRFYLAMASKQSSVSHTQMLCAGEVKGYLSKVWRMIVLGSQSNKHGQDCGFNYAFSYPQWTIHSSGILICQSSETQPSDGLWKIDDTVYKNYKGYQDEGHHIYPIF